MQVLPGERAHDAAQAQLCGKLGGINFDRCFQLMECEDAQLLEEWAANWRDLVEFEFVPVRTSKQAAELIAPKV